jgi:hypothetical protein
MLGTDMIKVTLKFSVFALIAALLASLCLTTFPQNKVFNVAEASSTLPVEGMEFADGSIAPENSPLLIWYNWVDVSGTQVVYYAIYTAPDYNYPVPIANLVGQHFRLADGTQVFIASALSELEVYRDLNSDGIPQADFTLGDSEILYLMYTNMSDSFSMTPVQKVMQDSIPHYQWSFTYENVHGYLQNAAARIGVAASLIFSHITLSYDFSVNGNVSNLKTNFDIGKVTNLNILDSSQFTLDGLSLALLYATATYTSKPYTTYVDGHEYNSTTAEDSAVDAELAQVQVNGVRAYDFVFGGSYTLNRGENNETHQANIETYEAKAEAAALSSISTTIRINPIKGMGFFRDQLNLADLFGGSWQDFNMNYETSSLIYRVCFPAWDGMQIQHDPVYVGYMLSTTKNSQVSGFPTVLALSVLAVIVVASLILFVIVRKRKRPAIQEQL